MSRRVRGVVEALEPKITVPMSEYMREVRKFRTIKERRGKLWREAMRNLSFWRWRRDPSYLEAYRRVRREISRLNREERELRRYFRRKIVRPYWRIDVAYQFQKTTIEPPYHFYAEFRKFVYTRNPEKYAIWNERLMEFTDPQSFMEEELRVIMFASSLLSRVRKDGTIAHGAWLEGIYDLRQIPFPNFECQPVDESEIDAPLDTQQYYVRIEKEGETYEYGTSEVEEWLRIYRRWLQEMAGRGIIRHPERYDRAIRQTGIDEFVKRFREARGE